VDSAPAIAVLAEGTAPVAIPYHAPPRRKTATVVALGAGAAILVAGIAIASSIKSRDTRAMTKRYPVAATAAEKTQLADRAAAWTRGKRAMLSTINGGLPALADLKGVGACTIVHARSTEELAIQPSSSLDDSDLAISTRMTVAAGHEREIVGMLSPSVDQLISSAQRARFRTPAGKAHVLAQLANAPLVIRVDQRREPELDREHDTVAPGVLAGTAYAFDPATGALRCAGSFRATSPAVPTLSRYAGLDAAEDAARADFALAVESAVVGSLRSID
jgi:hypothetical protein